MFNSKYVIIGVVIFGIALTSIGEFLLSLGIALLATGSIAGAAYYIYKETQSDE